MSKSIQGSVGWGGRNLAQDVVTVQYLLNCVPSGKGGPFPELAVDGLIGPKTIGAIRKFQKALFGHPDGRVDPGKRTIQTLMAYDPYPHQTVPEGAGTKSSSGSTKGSFGSTKSSSGGSGGKSGTGGAWGKSVPGKSGGWGKSV